MQQREILIIHNQTGEQEKITTPAANKGELKREISKSIDNKICVLAGSKTILAFDDSVLPEGKCCIFVYPRESKGGTKPKAKKKVVSKKVVKKTSKKAKSAPAKKKLVKKVLKKKISPAKKKAIAGVVGSVANKPKDDVDTLNALLAEASEIGRNLNKKYW